MDAKKSTITAAQAIALTKGVDEIYATKGKKVIHVVMAKDKPDADTLRGLLVGPSGNLRAPCLRTGRTLIVGFDEATYASLLAAGKTPTKSAAKPAAKATAKPAAKAKKK